MPADHDELARVEAACAALAAAGQPVTFADVAARARISRTTLYRRAGLRAVIDEHRARGQDMLADPLQRQDWTDRPPPFRHTAK